MSNMKGGGSNMNKKLKAASNKRRGRPLTQKSEEEKILSNGLFQRQWKRIQSECSNGGAQATLRDIVDWYFAQKDSEAQATKANEQLEDAARSDRRKKESTIK